MATTAETLMSPLTFHAIDQENDMNTKDPGMITTDAQSMACQKARSMPRRNSEPDMDSQTQAFMNGMKAQRMSGQEQEARVRAIGLEQQAHQSAMQNARQEGSLSGLTRAQLADLIRANAKSIISVLRDPNFKIGRSR